jgi:hypothetical protein
MNKELASVILKRQQYRNKVHLFCAYSSVGIGTSYFNYILKTTDALSVE